MKAGGGVEGRLEFFKKSSDLVAGPSPLVDFLLVQLMEEKYEGYVLSFLRSCHNSAAPSPHLSIKILNNSRRNWVASRQSLLINKCPPISCIPTPQRLVSKENLILDCYMEESFPLFLQSATPCTKPST